MSKKNAANDASALYAQFGAVDGLGPRESGYIDGKTFAKRVDVVRTRGPNGPEGPKAGPRGGSAAGRPEGGEAHSPGAL